MHSTAIKKNSEAGIPHVRSWLQAWKCRFLLHVQKFFGGFTPKKIKEDCDCVILQWNIMGITMGQKNKEWWKSSLTVRLFCVEDCHIIKLYKFFRERWWDVGNKAHMIIVEQLKIKTSSIVRFVLWSQFLQNFSWAPPPREIGKS